MNIGVKCDDFYDLKPSINGIFPVVRMILTIRPESIFLDRFNHNRNGFAVWEHIHYKSSETIISDTQC